MAESTASLSYDDLRRHMGRKIPGSTVKTTWTPEEASWIDDIIDSALRNLYAGGPTGYQWNFLRPWSTITTVAAYSTGTIAIAAGVVTGTGTTFPSWAAEGEVTVSGNTYTVNTRDSDTQLTLDDLTVAVSAGASYELGRPTYDLPDNCAYIEGPFTYRPGSAALDRPIELVAVSDLRELRQWADVKSRPVAYALRTKRPSDLTVASESSRHQVQFLPTSDAAYTLEYRYRIRMDKITGGTDKYPLGSEEHSETILAACNAQCELELEGRRGDLWAYYLDCLQTSIKIDSKLSASFLGYNYDFSESQNDLELRLSSRSLGNYVGYDGHTLIGE